MARFYFPVLRMCLFFLFSHSYSMDMLQCTETVRNSIRQITSGDESRRLEKIMQDIFRSDVTGLDPHLGEVKKPERTKKRLCSQKNSQTLVDILRKIEKQKAKATLKKHPEKHILTSIHHR